MFKLNKQILVVLVFSLLACIAAYFFSNIDSSRILAGDGSEQLKSEKEMMVKMQEDAESNLVDMEIARRVRVFRHLYSQIKDRYLKNGELSLPEKFSDIKGHLVFHSSIAPELIVYYGRSIRIDGTEMHELIMHDCADVGDGTARVMLFADGHIEIANYARE